MPILSYKAHLAPLVKNGSKPHTIRFSKRPWKAGDTAFHATGVRTRQYNNFRTDTVTRVDQIEIEVWPTEYHLATGLVWINDTMISKAAILKLALADGFETAAAFFQFFLSQYGPGFHRGQLIQWSPEPLSYSS